jgi:enoyl-CoA hydratase/carnithine racemase
VSDRLVLRTAPEDGVVTLTLNRAEKKNALSIALRDELSDALDDLGGDEAVKTVVITGAGDVFSAGFDLGEFQQPELADQLWASSDRFHATALRFPLPLVTAVNGPAIAGGFDLAVMSDVRVAADTARFSHPEIEFGDVVYGPLHDIVGGGLARELCFTGRVVEAREAKALGLVSSVVPVDELAGEVTRFTDLIGRAPRDVLLRTKAKAIRRAAVVRDKTLDL